MIRRLPAWLLAVLDQGVIAVTNLTLSIIFSRTVGLSGLGVYSLISVTLLSSLGMVRTLVGDPWMASRDSGDSRLPPQLRFLYVLSALIVTIPTAIVALVSGGGPSAWLLSCAVAPLFMIQDGARYVAYKRERTVLALMSDVLLFGGTLAGVLVGVALHKVGVSWTMGSWLFGYVLALVPVRFALKGSVDSAGARDWWNRVCRRLALPLLLDSVAYFVSMNVTIYILAAIASPSVVGSVRVVNSLYSPIALVFTGITMWLVPWLARRGSADTHRARRMATLALTTTAIVLLILMVLLGPWAAPLLFGPEADIARFALLLGGLATCFNAVASTWLATVRVFGRYRSISWTRAITGVLMVALLLLVPPTRSLAGYLSLLAFQNLSVMVAAWLNQRATLSQGDERPQGKDENE